MSNRSSIYVFVDTSVCSMKSLITFFSELIGNQSIKKSSSKLQLSILNLNQFTFFSKMSTLLNALNSYVFLHIMAMYDILSHVPQELLTKATFF